MYPEGAVARHGVPSHPIGALPQGRSRRTSLLAAAGPFGKAGRVAGRATRELNAALAAFRLLRGIDTLIVAGSGPLEDDPGSAYRLAKWALLARAAGAHVAVMSVGAGPLDEKANQRFVKVALRAANYVSVRDKGSSAVLASVGVSGPVLVQPDMGWAWPGLEGYCPSVGSRPGRPVGINVMSLNDPRYERGITIHEADWTRFNAYFDKILQVIEHLVNAGREVRLFSTESGHDAEVRAELFGAIVKRARCDPTRIVQPPSSTVQEAMDVIRGCSVVATTRFHAGVLSVASDRPTVALAYHHKTRDVFETLGIPELCLDAETFTVSELLHVLESAEELWYERRSVVSASVVRLRRQVEAQFDLACTLAHS
jgi:polysaccharide pyruvyl transferase WcaK-like protein